MLIVTFFLAHLEGSCHWFIWCSKLLSCDGLLCYRNFLLLGVHGGHSIWNGQFTCHHGLKSHYVVDEGIFPEMGEIYNIWG